MPAGRFRTAALSMKSYSSTPSAIKRVSLIPGDGIGPEIAAAVQRIFFVAKVPIEWDLVNVTPIIGEDGKTSLSPEALASFHSTRIGLKGPLATPIGTGHVSLNLLLRKFVAIFICPLEPSIFTQMYGPAVACRIWKRAIVMLIP